MIVTVWGARGSIPCPGPDTVRYGGNTACVEIRAADGRRLILDGGTGIRRLGLTIPPKVRHLDILLTHLHIDHILGLPFFEPLFRPDMEVRLWGPASTTHDLRARLGRYLSPPLFPLGLRDLPRRLTFHDVPFEGFTAGGFRVSAMLIAHPGPTVGFRIEDGSRVVTYLPDHEPALGGHGFALPPDWISGVALARDADLLIHDAQYTRDEYANRIGWGHSAIPDALAFAAAAGARRVVLFHHDPRRSDAALDALMEGPDTDARQVAGDLEVIPGREGLVVELA